MTESFPRQMAATRRFQLGSPRGFNILADASLVTFLRSDHGRDSVNSLWVFDTDKNVERKVADPRTLLADTEDIPDAERARRERMRETTGGITSYTNSSSGEKIAFALAGKLFTANLAIDEITELEVTGPIIDPQISPNGELIAWSDGQNIRVCDFAGTNERALTNETAENRVWGLADFIAAEEFGRMRGLWWSPTGTELIAQCTDDSKVNTWWISDPANPDATPREQKYPKAGSTNAEVSLHYFDLSTAEVGPKFEISWDKSSYEYLISVSWQSDSRPLVTVANRAQTEFVTHALTGSNLESVHAVTDPEFVEVIPGQPRWLGSEIVSVIDNRASDTRELQIGDRTVTPAGLQVMSVISVGEEFIDVIATSDAVSRQLVRVKPSGDIAHLTQDGVASATPSLNVGQDCWQIITLSRLVDHSRTYSLVRNDEVIHQFDSHAEKPVVTPSVQISETGPHKVKTAVLFPTNHVMGSKKLPILLLPYGGPHGAQVLTAANVFAEDQWFADQGFCVIVADNRGTPARGPLWDHAIYHDFVTPVLDDQEQAIADIVAKFPEDLDPNRVGISGWSFGGYLAALAVLARPNIFHAAVAGAPVTAWELYDTAYTERYLGNPNEVPDVYRNNSLLEMADNLTRPLLLIHGTADDNVVFAHTLQLSSSLLAHKGEHSVLPLSGVTHMTPQEVVAENIALQSVKFFAHHLQAE
ncbi:MAG: prolyl oligopeptidase family serine peptidase [Actinomycetales bacterium]|nr:prolyl oligopeptidase family serine peptidase [Actinomycetales bacterium]